MTDEEYQSMPVEERLNYAERAIGLMIGTLQREVEATGKAAKACKAEAVKLFKDGSIASALHSDAHAIGNTQAQAKLRDVLFRLKCWQNYSDTPDEILPFRLES